jgi:uncharacterized lipoprotein NlpE involved in copper resistance
MMNKSVFIAAALALAVVGCSDNKQAADAAKAAADKAAAAAKDATDAAKNATGVHAAGGEGDEGVSGEAMKSGGDAVKSRCTHRHARLLRIVR